eukprot:COSAG05_NODE_6916_length_881_cov_4.644501_1_plen_47_part_10
MPQERGRDEPSITQAAVAAIRSWTTMGKDGVTSTNGSSFNGGRMATT